MAKDITVYTLKEVEEILSVTRKTIYSWIKSGKLHAVKVGSQYRVKKEDLESLLNGEE